VVQDESTILRLRHLLEQHELTQRHRQHCRDAGIRFMNANASL